MMKRNKSLSPVPSSSDCLKKSKLENIKDNELSAIHILDFSDDLLLYILKYLTPQDLRSLSLCCQRLYQITQDRTLWKYADFRTMPMSLEDLRNYVRFFQPVTESIAIRGNLASKCAAKVNKDFISTIKTRCKQIKELVIEECWINGSEVQITDFPSSIERLSFEGCDIAINDLVKSYFFKMDLHMQNLTCLILSYCQWFSPHSLLVISKLPKLKELRLNSCRQLNECVAYASLATRFGFKSLEILDIRDTMIGDSEVSCFTSTKTLKHLYLEGPSSPLNSSSSLQHTEQVDHPELFNPVYDDHILQQFIVDVHPRVSRCNFITDRAIYVIANDSCDRRVINSVQGILLLEEDKRVVSTLRLKTLVVRNYPRITNKSLFHLAKNASSLEYLDVTATSVTRNGIQEFKSQRPDVTLVTSYDKTNKMPK
ncbi:uncharacterized protein [Prorops nasuta]|uniref:uncharacterized protein n=1 Tax=Prorops nasuta TaxID=863751 RepID=UPI0034CE9547